MIDDSLIERCLTPLRKHYGRKALAFLEQCSKEFNHEKNI